MQHLQAAMRVGATGTADATGATDADQIAQAADAVASWREHRQAIRRCYWIYLQVVGRLELPPPCPSGVASGFVAVGGWMEYNSSAGWG